MRNNDTKFADFTQMRIKHYNRTELVWAGIMTFFVDVGDDYQVDTRLYKGTGHQYKQTPYHLPRKNFCLAVKTFVDYEELRESSNIPDVCPWPKGKYEIYDHKVTNLSRWPPGSEGDFMIEQRFFKNDVFQNGYQVFVTII